MKRKKLFCTLLGGCLLLSGPAFGKGIEGIWKMTVSEPPATVSYTLNFTSPSDRLLTVTRTVYPEPTEQVSYFAYAWNGNELLLVDPEKGTMSVGQAIAENETVPESLSISGFDNSLFPDGIYKK